MEKDTEVLIMRNTTAKRLYDVVRVNYFEETVDFIAKGVQYEHAVAMVLELEEAN